MTTLKVLNEPISLADAKTYLRVEHTLEDTLISKLISVAREYAETYQNRYLAERVADDGSELSEDEAVEYEDPSELEIQAMYLLIAHYYENRATISATSINEIPLTVNALLYFNRKAFV